MGGSDRSREHILQSAPWGEVKSAWGRPAIRAGGAQFTVHRVARSLARLGYAPRVRPQGLDLAALAASAAEHGCAFVRIEPTEPLRAVPGIRLRRGRSVLGRASWVIDMAGGTDELWKRMRKNTRAHIRDGQRRGAVVKVGTSDRLLADLVGIQKITAGRHGFGSRPESYYRLVRDVFSRQPGTVHIVNAYYNDECVASEMLIAHDGTLYDMYGGTSGAHRRAMGSYAAVWRGLQIAEEIGCERFDFWSALAPDEERPDHPWYGFHQFKAGFGGTLIEYPGAYDLVIRPGLYHLLAAADRTRAVVRRVRAHGVRGLVVRSVEQGARGVVPSDRPSPTSF